MSAVLFAPALKLPNEIGFDEAASVVDVVFWELVPKPPKS